MIKHSRLNNASKIPFKLSRDEKTKKYFEKFAGQDRLTKSKLIEMMALRYPMGKYDEKGEY